MQSVEKPGRPLNSISNFLISILFLLLFFGANCGLAVHLVGAWPTEAHRLWILGMAILLMGLRMEGSLPNSKWSYAACMGLELILVGSFGWNSLFLAFIAQVYSLVLLRPQIAGPWLETQAEWQILSRGIYFGFLSLLVLGTITGLPMMRIPPYFYAVIGFSVAVGAIHATPISALIDAGRDWSLGVLAILSAAALTSLDEQIYFGETYLTLIWLPSLCLFVGLILRRAKVFRFSNLTLEFFLRAYSFWIFALVIYFSFISWRTH